MIKTPLRWNQCTQFAEARRDNLKLYLLLFCSNLQTKTKEVSLWRGARRYTHLYRKGKKKKKHNSVTHTAKVNIRVRCVAAGLKFRPGICLLLSAGIYLEFFFFFFLGWHFRLKDQSARLIILSWTPPSVNAHKCMKGVKGRGKSSESSCFKALSSEANVAKYL